MLDTHQALESPGCPKPPFAISTSGPFGQGLPSSPGGNTQAVSHSSMRLQISVTNMGWGAGPATKKGSLQPVCY